MFFVEEISPSDKALAAAVVAQIAESNGDIEERTMFYAGGHAAQSAAFAAPGLSRGTLNVCLLEALRWVNGQHAA